MSTMQPAAGRWSATATLRHVTFRALERHRGPAACDSIVHFKDGTQREGTAVVHRMQVSRVDLASTDTYAKAHAILLQHASTSFLVANHAQYLMRKRRVFFHQTSALAGKILRDPGIKTDSGTGRIPRIMMRAS